VGARSPFASATIGEEEPLYRPVQNASEEALYDRGLGNGNGGASKTRDMLSAQRKK